MCLFHWLKIYWAIRQMLLKEFPYMRDELNGDNGKAPYDTP